eukprot:gene23270-biopygen17803
MQHRRRCQGGEQNRTEQNRTEQNRTEQNRTEQSRTEQSRTERFACSCSWQRLWRSNFSMVSWRLRRRVCCPFPHLSSSGGACGARNTFIIPRPLLPISCRCGACGAARAARRDLSCCPSTNSGRVGYTTSLEPRLPLGGSPVRSNPHSGRPITWGNGILARAWCGHGAGVARAMDIFLAWGGAGVARAWWRRRCAGISCSPGCGGDVRDLAKSLGVIKVNSFHWVRPPGYEDPALRQQGAQRQEQPSHGTGHLLPTLPDPQTQTVCRWQRKSVRLRPVSLKRHWKRWWLGALYVGSWNVGGWVLVHRAMRERTT